MRVLYWLVMCLAVSTAFSGASQLRTQRFDAFPLSTLRDAGNSKIVQFHVPDFTETHSIIVQMFAVSSSKSTQTQPDRSCPLRNVTVFAQHGAQPLIVRGGFPRGSEFFLQRTSSGRATVSVENSQLVLNFERPLSGFWYVAAFLEPDVANDDDAITQKGLGTAKKTCNYFFQMIHLYSVSAPNLVLDLPINRALQRYLLTSRPIRDDKYQQYEILAGGSVVFRVLPFNKGKLTVFAYELLVEDCFVVDTRQRELPTSCPLIIAAGNHVNVSSSTSMASHNCSTRGKVANGSLICSLLVGIGNIAQPSFLAFSTWLNQSVAFSVRIHAKECTFIDSGSTNRSNETTNTDSDLQQVSSSSDKADASSGTAFCSVLPRLSKFYSLVQRFNFVLFETTQPAVFSIPVVLSDHSVQIVPFEIDHLVDQGGTLSFFFRLSNSSVADDAHLGASANANSTSSPSWRIDICVTRNALPIVQSDGGGALWRCDSQNSIVSNLSEARSEAATYYPYPETGLHFIAFRLVRDTTVTPKTQLPSVRLKFTVRSAPCFDGSCNGDMGDCVRTTGFQNLRYAFCSCKFGYSGFACTNESGARSIGDQASELALLTASNFALAPAILLATRRRFWMEAAVYTFTTVASAFYHACDTDTQWSYCVLPHASLSLLDFYGSLASFLVTTLCVAEIARADVKALVLTCSLLVALVAVTADRFAILSFAVPIGVCVAVLCASWARRCYVTRFCHPPRGDWLKRLLPGAVLLLGGLSLFLFLERKSNYYLVHSSWHVLVAFACAVLLPPRAIKSTSTSSSSSPAVAPAAATATVTTVAAAAVAVAVHNDENDECESHMMLPRRTPASSPGDGRDRAAQALHNHANGHYSNGVNRTALASDCRPGLSHNGSA